MQLRKCSYWKWYRLRIYILLALIGNGIGFAYTHLPPPYARPSTPEKDKHPHGSSQTHIDPHNYH
jgi:hypothetical protein